MLRTERPHISGDFQANSGGIQVMTRELLLAVAPPPQAHSYALSGWPTWLVPSFRSGGHRTGPSSSEAER